MPSSVTTPHRQSPATGLQAEDCPSTVPPLTGTPRARVSTFELQALEANTKHPPRPIDYVNGRRRTRFTLHRLLSAVIPTVFVASKFIDSFHGRALTLDLLDLIPAILGFILIVSSWFESDPPPYLGWLFDTDWDYLLDMTMRGVLFTKDLARRAKNNPSASLGIIFGAISVLLTIARAISLSRNYQPGGNTDSPGVDCLVGIGYISFLAGLMVVGGDRHQRTAYKHAFSMSAILTQLATLVSWTMDLWFPDRPQISSTSLCTGFCLWLITLALGCVTGHVGKLEQTKIFIFAWSSSILFWTSIPDTLKRLLNTRDPNFHHELSITIGTRAFNVFLFGLDIYFYFQWWWNLMRPRPL